MKGQDGTGGKGWGVDGKENDTRAEFHKYEQPISHT